MQFVKVFGFWWTRHAENEDWQTLINVFDLFTMTNFSLPIKAKEENLCDRDFPRRVGLFVPPAA